MVIIIKRNGKKEAFDKKRLLGSIQKAAISAGKAPSMDTIKKIAARIGRETDVNTAITTSEVREKVLESLDNSIPAVSAAWRKFDGRYKA